MTEIIFFGNGPLADYTLAAFPPEFKIIFHARTAADLATVAQLKTTHPAAHGILASFGCLIKPSLLQLFEPEGILNLHPSLLPQYRGPSPIETALLHGDTTFGLSIMKLVSAMDAGPLYHQSTLTTTAPTSTTDYPTKAQLYQSLATLGATWLTTHLSHLSSPTPQSGTPTFTTKFSKSHSPLHPDTQTAAQMLYQIRAFQAFPKTTAVFHQLECIIHTAHLATSTTSSHRPLITLRGADQQLLVIDELQPMSRKKMTATAFLNGYCH